MCYTTALHYKILIYNHMFTGCLGFFWFWAHLHGSSAALFVKTCYLVFEQQLAAQFFFPPSSPTTHFKGEMIIKVLKISNSHEKSERKFLTKAKAATSLLFPHQFLLRLQSNVTFKLSIPGTKWGLIIQVLGPP
jgi:hypothetical protein